VKMPKITILVGCPGSGKSTYAKDMIENDADHGAVIVRVSQDDQGKPGHMKIFEKALENNDNIIVDRMNFDKAQRNRYLDPAKKAGYETRIIVFHVPMVTCLERCNARVGHPTIQDSKSASQAVNFFFSNYERVSDDEADKIERLGWVGDNAPRAIYSDLDGTLCNVEHRRHFVRPPNPIIGHFDVVTEENPLPVFKKNWPAFFAGIKDDTVNDQVMDILNKYKDSHKIIYCTGRSDNFKRVTQDWLDKHNAPAGELYMRNRHDSRQDNIVKEILLDFEILTRFSVFFCLDDRNQVVDMLRGRGLVVMQVADGDF
jgi:predicted kinase